MLCAGVAAGVVVLLVAAMIALAGTESGSRWVLRRVAQFAPVEIDASGASGTLLTQLEIPWLRFENAGLKLSVAELDLNIDWSSTSTGHVALEHLLAGEVLLQTIDADPAEAGSAEIAMADLPVGLSAGRVAARSLQVNDIGLADIEVAGFDAGGRTFEAEDETPMFRFVDDVVVRVRPDGATAVIDIRSTSRVGVGDMGANADRIRRFRSLVTAR